MAKDIGKMHFRRMDEGTDADFAVLARVHEDNIRKLPDLLMGLLTNLQADEDYPIDRLQHSLQAATRALRDGRDDEYVVCALLHDIGESLGPFNHGEVVAAVLKPFVSEANCWMLEHHPVFQVYFYGQHLGIDPNARERYREQPLLRPHRGVLRALRRGVVRRRVPERTHVDLRADGATGPEQGLDAAAVTVPRRSHPVGKA